MASGIGEKSTKVQIFSLILTLHFAHIQDLAGEVGLDFFFFLFKAEHTLDGKGMFSSHGRVRAKYRGNGLVL